MISEIFYTLLGVQQGESLSPLLFCLFINDLNDFIKDKTKNSDMGVAIGFMKLSVSLFADNAMIFASTGTGLQESLDILSKYCIETKMGINSQKSKIMIIGGVKNDQSV